ncbi:PBECR4 domain-containing protein [Streptococcus lutetiensis]|uniref:PBECR4 domain-containing protein n=1 Tax=Streptococcus lutetiensis TaxID=150055 RepID=UPI0018ABF53A|nr:PBECR4 domain-containing protein [Streptococcus lutetiensis]
MANMQELLSQRFEARKQKLVSMDIVAVAESLGMKLKPGSSGAYYWEEHDSFHIYPNTNSFRWWSRSVGSNTIDLVQVVREELTGHKPNFKEAAAFLETGHFENVTVQPPVREPFEYYLERYEHSDFNIGRQYLKEERGLSDDTIDTFLASGNLASATRKKGDYFEPVIVFKSRDNDGKMIGASLQGIVENRVQHPERGRLKQIMKNSDGTAGFSLDIGNPKRLVFAEAPIDLMSYYELHKDELQDVKLVAMDGLKKSVISRYVADMLTDGKYSQTMSNEQIRGALDALNKTTNLLQEHPDLITLAVDNDEAGQNFVKGLQEEGIPVIPDLPPRQAAQKKMDWNDYLKQEVKPKTNTVDETWDIDDIQEQLSQESDLVGTQAVDVVYMNEVYLNQGYSLSLAIHSNEEVENLSDVAAPWTIEVMKDGQSLGYLAYGEDWGNDFDIEDELGNLENWVKVNQVTNHLYTQKDVNAFLATTQAVEPKRGEFVLKGGGIYDFGESQKEGEELRQRALDTMIADITDGETYYLWHDEELENLNAPDEAFINFHYHLKDIEYNQDNIHLFVEESSADGVTGYLSLDSNPIDADSIEDYLADQDWTFDQKVLFLKNLKTAVDETWDKVTDHYNEQFEAIFAQYGLSSPKEKAPEILQETEKANFEHQKKVENPIGDLPEQSQEAAPLPSTHEEYSLNESSPTQTQSQPLLHFTISEPEKSIYKTGYHPVNKKELNKLNRYAAQIQENANWYKDELADSNVTYFYKNNDNLEALKVTFKAEQYPHLVGIFAIDDDQSASKTLDDLAFGKGDYQNIMIANRGATFSKIQVLPDFKAVVDSNSFIFDDLSEVERMKRLDLAKAIRTEDKDVLIAFRNVDGEYLPASLMKVTNKLESDLSVANNKDILGIIGEKDGEFKVLSVNEEVIKDGGEKMLSIVKNGQLEDLSNTVQKAEWVIEFNEANLSGNVEIPNFTGAGLTEELLERIKDYDYRLYLASLNDEGEGYYKFYFNKIQDGKVVQQERLDVGDGLERNEEIYKFLEQELAPQKRIKAVEKELTAEDFSKVLDAVYNVGARVGKDNRKNISENLYPAWDKYFEYAERYDNNFDVIVKAARADNLLDENSDFYKEVWLKKIQEENKKVKDSDGDGLTDDEEIALGTNPYSPDTDGDGILDSVEKASGTDATNLSDTPDSRKEEMTKRDLTLSEMIKAKNTAALNQHLQEGIKDYFDSDNYKNYLEGMSHFNNYSARNIRLIKAQLPKASMVASFNEWKKRNGHVNKGEKALYVQAPITVIKKDVDGNPIINSETGEKETLTYFKPVPVFDISQVSPVKGKELNLPKMGEVIPSQITKEYYQNVYRALRDISQKENGIPIRFRELDKSDGSYSRKTNEITIKKGMTYEQTLSTLIHEMAHSELHNKKSLTERFEGKLTRSSKELQAESIAYVVSNHLGFDTSNDSFAYLASWSKEADGLENLKAQLEIVQEEASSLMTRIDKHLEKYQNLTVSKDEKLNESQKRELEKTANPFYQSLQKAKGETVQTAPAKEEQSKKVNRPMKQ